MYQELIGSRIGKIGQQTSTIGAQRNGVWKVRNVFAITLHFLSYTMNCFQNSYNLSLVKHAMSELLNVIFVHCLLKFSIIFFV